MARAVYTVAEQDGATGDPFADELFDAITREKRKARRRSARRSRLGGGLARGNGADGKRRRSAIVYAEDFLEDIVGESCMPHSWLSLLNFDILRWQLYRNGEASSQGLSEHDCHCGSRRRKARNAVEVSAAASGADTSTVFSDAAANDRTNTLETLEILEGVPEEFAGKSAFGVCKFCWNCATVLLLIIALVFAVRYYSTRPPSCPAQRRSFRTRTPSRNSLSRCLQSIVTGIRGPTRAPRARCLTTTRSR